VNWKYAFLAVALNKRIAHTTDNPHANPSIAHKYVPLSILCRCFLLCCKHILDTWHPQRFALPKKLLSGNAFPILQVPGREDDGLLAREKLFGQGWEWLLIVGFRPDGCDRFRSSLIH
jgi:hypothetical protein